MAIFLDETSAFDLSPAQYAALSLIAGEPGMDQTRLIERSALDRSSVTKIVERLENRGAISRTISATDKRARHLFATPGGMKLLDDVRESVLRSQARIVAPLGTERAAMFLAMLREVAAAHNEASRVPLRDTDVTG